MRATRRTLLRQLAGVATVPAWPLPARSAFDYPSRPVHVVNGFAPGGQTDIFASVLGQWLSERLGQPFVLDSRPGATNIAVEEVVRAQPDGHTLLWITTADVINTTLYDKLSFNFIRDIAPITGVDFAPLVMAVNPSLPVRTVPEFVTYAKAHRGKISYGSDGVGSTQHAAGELFKALTGVDMIHVPYRDTVPVLDDLLASRIQITFSPVPSSLNYIRSGQLRALGVTTAIRSEVLPEIPPVQDYVSGFEVAAWDGIGAPAETPPEMIDKLNQSYSAALADPAIKARFAELGSTTMPLPADEFGKLLVAQTDKWAQIVKFAKMKAQ